MFVSGGACAEFCEVLVVLVFLEMLCSDERGMSVTHSDPFSVRTGMVRLFIPLRAARMSNLGLGAELPRLHPERGEILKLLSLMMWVRVLIIRCVVRVHSLSYLSLLHVHV